MKLIVGLGNPGTQYERTRHNAGFWLVDRLARSADVTLRNEARCHGLAARATIAGEQCWLLEPQTFMNLSGRAVAALAGFYRIDPSDVIVAHDELDLPPGTVKMKLGGGFAGHNGLKDITAQLGTRDFWRIRLGIGHPGDKSQVHGYVLNAPRPEEQVLIDDAIARSLAVIDWIARGDYEGAMLRLHTRDTRAEPASAPSNRKAST
jgi:PTH1 family peptidyl-tRNA hydrolase